MKYRTVLLVEDDAALRGIIARNLRARSNIVIEAETAGQAIASLSDLPDLILLDINLPDRSGWDVLRHLKARGETVPTVIVSAVRVSADHMSEFKPLAHLPKPFPIEALLRLFGEEEPTSASVESRAEHLKRGLIPADRSAEPTVGPGTALRASGILWRLRPAWQTLAETPEDQIRSVTLSMAAGECSGPDVAEAITRLAEEHGIRATVEQAHGRLVVHLTRKLEDT